MSTKTTNCITIACDTCDEIAGDYDTGSTHHFADLDEARKYLDDWRINDETQTCYRCLAIETCEREGHQWSRWYPRWDDNNRSERFCEREHCDAVGNPG